MGIYSGISTESPFVRCFLMEVELRNTFMERGKAKNLGKKLCSNYKKIAHSTDIESNAKYVKLVFLCISFCLSSKMTTSESRSYCRRFVQDSHCLLS